MKKDAVVIVTGGNGYLGGTIARKIKDEGGIPVIFDLHTDNGYAVDITDYEAVEKAVKSVNEQYGRIDGLVNCAGGSARGQSRPFVEQEIGVIRHILEMNLCWSLGICNSKSVRWA